MISEPTVLVLGAGVSKPYGYPIGSELVQDVFLQIVKPEWTQILLACSYKQAEIDEFRSRLHQSHVLTIDAFLEQQREFSGVGKSAIALSLLTRENPDAIHDFEVRNVGIYDYLLAQLRTDWQSLGKNKLSIITFNYDRSLEYFLFTALEHGFGQPREEIAAALNAGIVPVIHVHGSLGPLPWQSRDGSEYFPLFAGHVQPAEIKKRVEDARNSIFTVAEASQQYILARERIRGARRIYFLGFGYDESNLGLLGLSEFNFVDVQLKPRFMNAKYQSRHISGSAMHLGTAQIEAIQNKWRIRLPDNTSNALEFLRNYAVLT